MWWCFHHPFLLGGSLSLFPNWNEWKASLSASSSLPNHTVTSSSLSSGRSLINAWSKTCWFHGLNVDDGVSHIWKSKWGQKVYNIHESRMDPTLPWNWSSNTILWQMNWEERWWNYNYCSRRCQSGEHQLCRIWITTWSRWWFCWHNITKKHFFKDQGEKIKRNMFRSHMKNDHNHTSFIHNQQIENTWKSRRKSPKPTFTSIWATFQGLVTSSPKLPTLVAWAILPEGTDISDLDR